MGVTVWLTDRRVGLSKVQCGIGHKRHFLCEAFYREPRADVSIYADPIPAVASDVWKQLLEVRGNFSHRRQNWSFTTSFTSRSTLLHITREQGRKTSQQISHHHWTRGKNCFALLLFKTVISARVHLSSVTWKHIICYLHFKIHMTTLRWCNVYFICMSKW